jgi:hypothetical protein
MVFHRAAISSQASPTLRSFRVNVPLRGVRNAAENIYRKTECRIGRTERRQKPIAVRENKTGNCFRPLNPGFGRTLSFGKQEKAGTDLVFALRRWLVDREVHGHAYACRPHVEVWLSAMHGSAIEFVDSELVVAALESVDCLNRTATIALYPIGRARLLFSPFKVVRGFRDVLIELRVPSVRKLTNPSRALFLDTPIPATHSY